MFLTREQESGLKGFGFEGFGLDGLGDVEIPTSAIDLAHGVAFMWGWKGPGDNSFVFTPQNWFGQMGGAVTLTPPPEVGAATAIVPGQGYAATVANLLRSGQLVYHDGTWSYPPAGTVANYGTQVQSTPAPTAYVTPIPTVVGTLPPAAPTPATAQSSAPAGTLPGAAPPAAPFLIPQDMTGGAGGVASFFTHTVSIGGFQVPLWALAGGLALLGGKLWN